MRILGFSVKFGDFLCGDLGSWRVGSRERFGRREAEMDR